MSTVVGLVAAKLNTSGRLDVAGATTHALIDYRDPSIVDARATPQHVGTLQKRAELFGWLITTEPALKRIAARAGLPADQISAVSHHCARLPITLTQPGSEERASQIRDSRAAVSTRASGRPEEPILSIYSQAPSVAEAERLADAPFSASAPTCATGPHATGCRREQARIQQLGEARGAVVTGHARS